MADQHAAEDWPPKFTLDQERILNLLTGDRFYSNASAALREAVLNAIDATTRQRANEPGLAPQIAVLFDREQLRLSISDNGDGMDRPNVSSLFTRIGASAAQMDSQSGAVGEFGIGVISYFMAGDSFTVETFDGTGNVLGLKFDRTMLAGGEAEPVAPSRTERGTTITIQVRDEHTFDLLMQNFPHWCRDVEGLTGREVASGAALQQGGAHSPGPGVDVGTPDWVERAHLSPVSGMSSWDSMSGTSTISVLYRGVFVQEFSVRGVWGIQGSIDVNPKHFKPKLNRESFVQGEFQVEVEQFLRVSHPTILLAMAQRLASAFEQGELDKWNSRRWATLWLSIPRDDAYKEAAAIFDQTFRNIPAFESATGDTWNPIALEDLLKLGPTVYLAPNPDEKQTDLIKAAVRLLRHTKASVIRGLRRDSGWLRDAGNYFGTTADLIAQVFSEELPELIHIAPQAETFLAKLGTEITLFDGPPPVELVHLGQDGPPVLGLKSRLVINLDNPEGRSIIGEAVDQNEGRASLIAITARHSRQHITQVAAVVADPSEADETLGLVKRRYIRRMLS